MLLGKHPARIASGHRVSVPFQFRKELGNPMILARWYEGCLVLVGSEFWNALYKRLIGESRLLISPVRDTERFIMASAYEVYPDDQGRIIIPENLIEYSNLKEDVYFIGLGEKAEIWSKEIWEDKEKEIVLSASEYIEKLERNEK